MSGLTCEDAPGGRRESGAHITMNSTTTTNWRPIASWRRAGTALTIVIAAGLAVGACGSGDSGTKANPGSSGGPKGAAALVAKGLGEQAAGDLASAKRDYTQAIVDDPKNKFAYYNLGLIQQIGGDKAAAETNYRLALSIDPKFAQPLYNLAILRAAANSLAEAIDLYRRAIAASPKAADAHFNLGLLLRKSGNITEGNLEVQTAVKLDPSLASRAKAQGIPTAGN
jgi:tetratricopeptide (TPR) repeat protein